MDWRREAEFRLRSHEARLQAIKGVSTELDILAKGGLCGQCSACTKDAHLNTSTLTDELTRAQGLLSFYVDRTETALSFLDADELRVLDAFYIHPIKGAAEVLMQEWNCDIKSLYRRRDHALRQFTLAMFGMLET